MAKGHWLIGIWPGLAELWDRGSWSALALALGYAALLNLALLVTLVWTELISPALRIVAWAALVLLSLISLVAARRQPRNSARQSEGLFSRCLGEYLQGHWYEAESLALEILRYDPRDVDAVLLLATLYRHTDRLTEAQQMLEKLGRLEGAAKWAEEIAAEYRFLAERRQRGPATADSTDLSRAA